MTCLRPKNLTLNPVPSHSFKKKNKNNNNKETNRQTKQNIKGDPKRKKKEEETLKLWEACQRLNGTFK